MEEVNISELKDLVRDFCKERDWEQFHNPKDIAIKISVEASELLEKFEWVSAQESSEMMDNPKKRQDIEDELSDVLYNILAFAYQNDINLSAAFKTKLAKIAINYPVDKAKGSKVKYTEL